MPLAQSKIRKLKTYFKNQDNVLMAFVFGSRAKKKYQEFSDWDIACYFKSIHGVIELEEDRNYADENRIWEDLVKILKTDNVDFVVLNRAPAQIAASVLRNSIPLAIKDMKLYLEFMLRTTNEAEDFRQTAKEYADVYWRSSSLSEEDKSILGRRLIFLDSELKDAFKFRKLNQFEYQRNNAQRREVERWVENLMNAAIDIAKTILASEKRPIPASYREVLLNIGSVSGFSKDMAQQLADWSALRNILAHEYLDIRWKRIEKFIKKSELIFSKFIKVVKKKIK